MSWKERNLSYSKLIPVVFVEVHVKNFSPTEIHQEHNFYKKSYIILNRS